MTTLEACGPRLLLASGLLCSLGVGFFLALIGVSLGRRIERKLWTDDEDSLRHDEASKQTT